LHAYKFQSNQAKQRRGALAGDSTNMSLQVSRHLAKQSRGALAGDSLNAYLDEYIRQSKDGAHWLGTAKHKLISFEI
jgi:hypothetical protein